MNTTTPMKRKPPAYIRNQEQVLDVFQRRSAKLTQTVLAKHAGVSVQNVCDVTKGRRLPSGKLLEYLGYEIAFLRRRPPANENGPDSVR